MKIPAKTLILGGGIVIGVAGVLAVRFATYQKPYVHYHANFAVYINGQREAFENPIYYAEGGCTAEGVVTPQMRAHLHDNVSDVVHVEDEAVTWGNFFENLWWSVGNDFIQKPDGTLYKADGTNRLHLIINGQNYTGLGSLASREINDTDRVLVSFGNGDKQALQAQYDTVASTAAQYNTAADPATCGGVHRTTIKDKLKNLF